MPNHNLSRDEAAARSTLVSTHSYEVSLDVRGATDPDTTGYPSRSVINFSATPGSSTFLDFIGESVHSVFLNGKDLPIADVVDGSRIRLDNLQAENQVTVTAIARYSNSGEGMHRFVDPADGKVYLYTQYEPSDARRVFANFEQPDLKAEFTFHVMAPSEWHVASNGAEADRVQLTSDPATSRWDFAPTKRMSTYITSVLAGPYFKAEDHWSKRFDDGRVLEVPLALYCRASLKESFDGDKLFGLTKAGLDFFHGLFDYPYPWGKYDQAFVPEYNLGAMENPGLVTFTDKYIYTSRATDSQYQGRANTLMHEMAHMWFGDLVTMAWWDDLWLKESLADFMGTLAVDQATHWDTAWVNFADKRKAWAYVQDQLPTTHPIVADIPDLEAAKQNFDGITYAKGASVLKQLVAYVGFEAFIQGARRYFRDHEFGNTSLQDLLTALESSSGRDLTGWSARWLQTSGISTLSADINDDGVRPESGSNRLAGVSIRQDALDPATGKTENRPHLLKVGLYDFDGEDGPLVRTDSVTVEVNGALTGVPELDGKPRPALLLLNDEDLSYAKVRLDPLSEATVRTSLDRITDPMARALCWTALWDAARDGVSPAELYVRAVQQFAPTETGMGVLLNIQSNAMAALKHYVPAESRGDMRTRFLDTAVTQLHTAASSSDQQLAWARATAEMSRYEDSALTLLRGLLDGTQAVPGLTVDAELRWAFWHALAAHGIADKTELDAELAADKTASGRAGHATALAAWPDPEIKAAAWNSVVNSSELSNELLSATITGFNTAPAGLLNAYIEPYFECLERVWSERSIEIAGRIVRGLYPSQQDLEADAVPAEHPVVRRTTDWLETHPKAPRALRRIVIEQQSHLLRALTAQAAGAAAVSQRYRIR
ncbi:aminopeptidase N [Arthrobacter sp. ISL-30]|uniref:aminopeptidase N n=1 Tax=Arthrobacter sp. ISL-30 TaxID=2819109 RepID=UPI001BE5D655|nr:aminopeptidase N [Arthrobacter sp. ISL-30]MBT2512875.1 aminopeptidase N [Arthrobacter sp. ISL-30]